MIHIKQNKTRKISITLFITGALLFMWGYFHIMNRMYELLGYFGLFLMVIGYIGLRVISKPKRKVKK